MSNNKTFVIPSVGNEISKLDVKDHQIRITVDFKPYFPAKTGKIKVMIEKEYECTSAHRGDRSHILRLGKDAAAKLGLKAGGSVKFTMLGKYEYQLAKI